MEAFTTLRAVAAPLMRDNVNTDVIIRIEHLFSRRSPDELGGVCFESWRFLPDGTENPDFVFNQPPYRSAKILLAGHNFACGSSREGAVTALMGMGIRCVIASSFGDIFFNNCFQNGLLPVVLSGASIDQIVTQERKAPGQHPLEVDLYRQVVSLGDGTEFSFAIPALRRAAMLAGLDEIRQTLTREASIASFQTADKLRRPWIYGLTHPNLTNSTP